MKMIPSLLVLAFICGCATVPSATKSPYLITDGAGVNWTRGDNTMSAFIDLVAQPSAPDVMYLEVVFPDPSQPGGQEVVRKEYKKADGRLRVDGSKRSGWQDRKTYTYIVRVYADSDYKTLLGVHEQRSVYYDPRTVLR
jgi:hypothetical protein